MYSGLTAVVGGFERELGRLIARLLGKSGLACVVVPTLREATEHPRLPGANLVVLGTATADADTSPGDAMHCADERAPFAKIVMVASNRDGEFEAWRDHVAMLPAPVDLGSYIEFCETVRSIGRETACTAAGRPAELAACRWREVVRKEM